MGLILFPILVLAFIMWVLCVVFLIIRISKGQMTSFWSIPLGCAIPVFTYIALLFVWSSQKEVWVLQPSFTLLFSHVILPGILGLMGVYASKEQKLLNIIGFAMCISAVISPVVFILFDGLFQADTFIDVKLIH